MISPYILDITDNKGGLMVLVKSHIPSSRLNDLKIPSRSNVQIIPFEVNFRKEKWLVALICCCSSSSWSLKYTNPKINLTQVSCEKTHREKNISYSRRMGYFSLNFKRLKDYKF